MSKYSIFSQKFFVIFFLTILFLFVVFSFFQNKKPIIAAVVPHHLIAADMIEDFFVTLKKETPHTKIIVLISPDHFHRIPAPIVTGNSGNTPEPLLRAVQSLGIPMAVDVRKEHGIFNLMPFIEKTFPDIKVLPVLVGENVSFPLLDALSETLAS